MNHYEKEKNDFEVNFQDYKEKRIVLYGIGRFTATLIPLLSNWNIVGLMDRDQDKVGTYIYGLPILTVSEAEGSADLIIINTSASYWNLIYQRIKNIKIPVYFRNGERAEDIAFQEKVEYWDSSYEQLQALIDSHNIISFDFFDTLFLRKVYMASDIWEYVGDSFNNETIKNKFLELRKSVYANVINKKIPDLNDLYKEMQLYDFAIDISVLKRKEIDLEYKFIEPRHYMVSLVNYALKRYKEVYIISDMYLKADFFLRVLKENGINLSRQQIWISCEHNHTKRSGELWIEFQKEIVKEKRGLHIGDNIESDINNCKRYSNLNTYFVMSKDEMLRRSSIKKSLEYAQNDYHYIILGLCMAKLFNDPFALCKTQGKVNIKNRMDFGYIVFGPIIFTFIYWLMKSAINDSIQSLCFLGRDGFFLKKDFEYVCKLICIQKKIDCSYLETSRQILMCAGIEDESDFIEYIKMPYQGKLKEFLEDRLGIDLSEKDRKEYMEINICLPQDYEKVNEIISSYKEHIITYILRTKNCYQDYLNEFDLGCNTAVIDLGFYGTTQHYLSRILGKEMIGYYLVADTTDGNVLNKEHILKSCTNVSKDKTCKCSYLHSMGLAMESFLTAPHGMVRAIKENGKFIYAPDTNNQNFFEDKMEINEGIQLFINDMIQFHYKRLSGLDIYIDDFVDNWYGLLLKNSLFSEEITRSFYNDNAFIHRRQERIFDV